MSETKEFSTLQQLCKLHCMKKISREVVSIGTNQFPSDLAGSRFTFTCNRSSYPLATIEGRSLWLRSLYRSQICFIVILAQSNCEISTCWNRHWTHFCSVRKERRALLYYCRISHKSSNYPQQESVSLPITDVSFNCSD